MNNTANVGAIEYDARINTSLLKADSAKADAIAKQTGDNIGKSADKGVGLASAAFKKLAATAKIAGVAVGAAVTAAVVGNINNAIKRVDTLNNSMRTFANMGFKTKDVTKSMKDLEQSIRGLPTPLDGAVRGMTMIAASTRDIQKSQKIFSALNNAILGFGGNAEQVNTTVVQLSQGFANNKIGGQEWISMMNNGMGPVLNSIAKEMKLTTGELKEGLSEGTISVEKFQDTLIKLNVKGGGGMKSLEQIAKDSTSGIATGWANMNTAITRGLAKIIEAIGSTNIANFISGIGSAFENSAESIIEFGRDVLGVGDKIGAYLMPKLTTLWNTLNTRLIPSLTNLWNNVLKPLGQEIGVGLVGAIGLVIDAFNAMMVVLTPVIDFLARNKEATIQVAKAIGLLWLAMKITSGISAFTNGLSLVMKQLALTRASIATTRGSVGLLRASLAKGMSLTILIGGALIALEIVYQKFLDTKAAMEGEEAARQASNRTRENAIQGLNAIAKGKAKGDKAHARKVLKSWGVPGYAQGTMNSPGGMAVVGEKGPELVNLPKGSQVIPNHELYNNKGSSIENHIGNIYISNEVDADRFIRRLTQDQEIIGKGLIPQTRYN